MDNQAYHYNYQALDQLLGEMFTPQEIGDELDEAMNDLVSYASDNDNCCETLGSRHYKLRELRNAFWKIGKS